MNRAWLIGCGIYLTFEALVFIYACLQPPDLGWEILPFLLVSLPASFLFALWPPLGLLAPFLNIVLIYGVFRGVQRILSRRRIRTA